MQDLVTTILRVRVVDKIYSSSALPAKACGNFVPLCKPYYCVQVQQVDRNADHVGPKLFEPGPELMQSKQASATERSHVT